MYRWFSLLVGLISLKIFAAPFSCVDYKKIVPGQKLEAIKKLMNHETLATEDQGKTYKWVTTDGVVFQLSFYKNGKFAEAADAPMINLLPNEEEFVNLYRTNQLKYLQAENLMGPGKQVGYFYTYTFTKNTGLALFTDMNNVVVDKISNVC